MNQMRNQSIIHIYAEVSHHVCHFIENQLIIGLLKVCDFGLLLFHKLLWKGNIQRWLWWVIWEYKLRLLSRRLHAIYDWSWWLWRQNRWIPLTTEISLRSRWVQQTTQLYQCPFLNQISIEYSTMNSPVTKGKED